MKIIEPNVEFVQYKNNIDIAAKCARICYASDKNYDNDKLLNHLIDRKHYSMFRHQSFYYIVPFNNSISSFLNKYKECPYISYVRTHKFIYISTNGQFVIEHPILIDKIKNYELDFYEFKYRCPFKELLRYTFIVTTQISTSRELNRTSPNNIAEQSTRYVNFGNKGGITICKPYWYDSLKPYRKFICRIGWKISETLYNLMLKFGLRPQDAREFLPLCAATKVAYTYTVNEWSNILNLRYKETTGPAHPNAKHIVTQIFNYLNNENVLKENNHGILI